MKQVKIPWKITEEEKKKGFVSLFNGMDLSNWRIVLDDVWMVKDGVITTEQKGKSWIRPPGEFENFVLRLEYMLAEDSNSGIFIRTNEDGRPAFAGMEIQLLDDYGKDPDIKSTGSIYGAVAPKKNMSKPAGEWNQIEVSANGPQIRVWLNGETVIDENVDEHTEEIVSKKPAKPLKYRLRRGYVGLQKHKNSTPVFFRNVRIKA